METETIRCESCGAPVDEKKDRCEYCGSYYKKKTTTVFPEYDSYSASNWLVTTHSAFGW